MQEQEATDLMEQNFSFFVNGSMLIGLVIIFSSSFVFGLNYYTFGLVCLALGFKLVEDLVNGE